MFFASCATFHAGECQDTCHEDMTNVMKIARETFDYEDEEPAELLSPS
jgi:hypothetical protein